MLGLPIWTRGIDPECASNAGFHSSTAGIMELAAMWNERHRFGTHREQTEPTYQSS